MSPGERGVGELAYIIIDCHEPELLAEFWGKLLGLPTTQKSHPYVDLAPASDSSPVISFQKVNEDKNVKNRLHLDIKVEELKEATERIQALGGKLIKICIEDPYEWRVMADPEDNEFCIVTD
jgi:predicted enzyme related to lactoylglutathione lyase